MLFELIYGVFAMFKIETESEMPAEDIQELQDSINRQLSAINF